MGLLMVAGGGGAMSHVGFKERQCPMSLNFLFLLSYLMLHEDFKKWPMSYLSYFIIALGSMSHVNFKKLPCHHVKFKG